MSTDNEIYEEISWNVEVVQQLINKEKDADNLFVELDSYFTVGIRFSDSFWDFNFARKIPLSADKNRFDFAKIISKEFRVIIKKNVIRDLYISKNNRTTTTHGYYMRMRRFALFLQNEKFMHNFAHITPSIIQEYIDKKLSNTTKKNISTNLFAIRKMLDELEFGGYSLDYSSFEPIMNSIPVGEIIAESESNKHPNIPKQLHERIIKCALRDMEDETLRLQSCIMACLIVILARTGMRNGELRILEAGKLKEETIFKNKKSAYYLEFFTFKTTSTREGRWTQTFLFPDSLKAYQTLEKITEEQRNKLNTNYLVNSYKGRVLSNTSFYDRFDGFFLRHQEELGFNSLSEIEKLQLKQRTFKNLLEAKTFKSNYCEPVDCDLLLSQPIYTLNPHQFRVALANWLKDRGLTIEWIREHMNHMESEMTMWYFRDPESVKETLYYRASMDGTRIEAQKANLVKELTDPDLVQAYETINKFLKKKKLNIFKNIDEILRILKKSAVKESLVGMCTKAIGTLCEQQKRLALLEKHFYISYQLPDITSFDFNYKRLIEKLKVVEHNKALSQINPKFQKDYELEFTALKNFYQNRFKPEHEDLVEKVAIDGEIEILKAYPQLKQVIGRLTEIDKEVQEWVKKLNLENLLANEQNNIK
ncbi:tyrosine-type recombinase/integrase [Pelosinus propionicus]|uniref:Phage integrase family protein n=1 Tax=Pelosinus propionicus DSM 13327 TaxID=1123291 RepID=A0A1I4JUP3_9FIRM|nr:tyrosine-type recombinase/integrase [Pelosinus propionicus]SFL70305.1 Phage integrase family protein [Pelosinus propionicus DSM 13327]